MVYPHNKISGNKKEWSTKLCYNLDKPRNIRVSDTDNHKRSPFTLFHLAEMPRTRKSIDRKYISNYLGLDTGRKWVVNASGYETFGGGDEMF